MKWTNLNQVYFIGIGGIGMSALARFFVHEGKQVAGYDKTKTPLTEALEAEGIAIHYKDNPELVPSAIDLAIYTPAIPEDHKELNHIKQKDIPLKKRAEVLGLISEHKRTIAIAGTHGKTTTTTLLTYLLKRGGVDCTAFLGGIAKDFKSNFVPGKSPWVVVEADEYDRSFLHLSPEIAVILSMDADHLDVYGDADAVLQTGYGAFIKKIKNTGKLFLNEGLTPVIPEQVTVERYGLERGNAKATRIKVENGAFYFDYEGPNEALHQLKCALPGRHNIENATVAIRIALELGVSGEKIRLALSEFKGIKRRFERIVETDEMAYIDDYAHHPTELRAAIGAARELFPDKHLLGIFQPHLYSRTRDFADEFAKALELLDEVWLLDIYPAREKPIPGINSTWLLGKINRKAKKLMTKNEVLEAIKTKHIEVLLTLGAGDISDLAEPLRKQLTINNE